MARRRPNSQSSVYISTNPQNNVPIGVPGSGVAIGRMGVLIYEGTSEQPGVSELHLFGITSMTFIPTTVIPTLEF